MRLITRLGSGALVCASLAFAQQAASADANGYPAAKPIAMTVLFPTGSSADVTARILAEGMARRLGTQIVVINRPGGGGAIGYKYVAAQAPDGYHLVWNSNSISTTYHTGASNIDYKAFDGVARVLIETPLLVVKSGARWKSLRDMVAEAKRQPGKITVGNSGAGSHTHFSSITLFRAAGVQVLDVPFGAAQVVTALLGGHVDSAVQLPGAVVPHVKSGSLRVLAAMSGSRDPAFPDVPTAAEEGVNARAEAWRGVAVPKGTPRAVIAKLEDAIRKTVESPEFRQAAERLSVAPAFLPAAEFDRLMAQEDREVQKIVTALGLEQAAK